ncbi:hypothetical protein [Natrialba sp. PRR66]|uniref:hypothetical protein n=1 Tax=Natrialba sp. PRR66 TaxID=3098146 RepID=UPI002B1E8E97|nr:hypothetical protein [Natrialba sp. PRR66]
MSSRASALESSKASGDALERGDRDLAAELEYDANGNPKKLRIDVILSLLKRDSFENARQVAQEAIDAWQHSGNDVVPFSKVSMVWRTPGGGKDCHRVGSIADW